MPPSVPDAGADLGVDGASPSPLHRPAAAGTVVVSNAGPLISLARLDLVTVLQSLFEEVQVPDDVIVECMARPGNADTVRISDALKQGLLRPCTPRVLKLPGLEIGECAAISRALEIGAALLVDERAARAQAAAMGLAVTGTLGVLVRARRRGLVGPLAPLIGALRASGQRLSHQVVAQALADVGEVAP